MNILDEIRAEVGAVLEDTALFFSEAALTRPAEGGGDWSGNSGQSQTFPCKAMVEAYSDHLRAVGDIPDTDIKLMIVGTSITTTPRKGDTVRIGLRKWSLIRVDTDPAQAMWSCQARPV